MSAPKIDPRPLIAHVVFSFDYGGLENGVINLVNGLPQDAFRHTIIALTSATGIRARIRRADVDVHALNKRHGKDPMTYLRLFRLLRQLRPAIVHTRNIGTVEGALVARLAGVPHRIHSEHGWDVFDPEGTNRKYRALRRVVSPAINRFVTVSRELEDWLISTVGIPAAKVQRICNGVETEKFRPAASSGRCVLPPDKFPPHSIVVGTVTRFSAIKDPLNLVRAFIEARGAPGGERLRLAMIGDGSLRQDAETLLRKAGATDLAWFPGSRDDIPELLRELNVFALGSLREGISNTILEAMSSGLPVVATATEGNGELVEPGVTGFLVQPGNASELAQAIMRYANDEELRRAHGQAGRLRAVSHFSLPRMLADYDALYSRNGAARQEAAA
jgi:sugar transferase (PEP-CTERM/EpsH1 system associated)